MSDDTGPARMTGASTTREEVERIWLSPQCCADPDTGRQWASDPHPRPCGDPACPGPSVPVEYVRADIHDAARTRIEELSAEVERMREALSVAEKRLDIGAVRLAGLGDARAAYGLKEWAAEARAVLKGAPRHD